MKDLIEALQILFKYMQDERPTHCEHDILYVKGPKPKDMSEDDVERLHQLSFDYDKEPAMWLSCRFGSC